MHEMSLAPVHNAFYILFDNETIDKTISYMSGKAKELPVEINSKIFSAVNKVNELAGQQIETSKVIEEINSDIESYKSFYELNSRLLKSKTSPEWYQNASFSFPFNKKYEPDEKIFLQLIVLHNIFQHSTMHNLFDQVDMYRVLNNSFKNFGVKEDNIYRTIYLIKSLTGNDKYPLLNETKLNGSDENRIIYISDLFFGENIAAYLNIHEYMGTKYFHKENFETLLDWLFLFTVRNYFKENKIAEKKLLERVKAHYSFFETLKKEAEESSKRTKKTCKEKRS